MYVERCQSTVYFLYFACILMYWKCEAPQCYATKYVPFSGLIKNIELELELMLKLTQGQGHKVKGQGHICNFVKKLVLTIYHEPMIAHWWCTYTW